MAACLLQFGPLEINLYSKSFFFSQRLMLQTVVKLSYCLCCMVLSLKSQSDCSDLVDLLPVYSLRNG